jgi:hypothetical protein
LQVWKSDSNSFVSPKGGNRDWLRLYCRFDKLARQGSHVKPNAPFSAHYWKESYANMIYRQRKRNEVRTPSQTDPAFLRIAAASVRLIAGIRSIQLNQRRLRDRRITVVRNEALGEATVKSFMMLGLVVLAAAGCATTYVAPPNPIPVIGVHGAHGDHWVRSMDPGPAGKQPDELLEQDQFHCTPVTEILGATAR